MTCAKCKETYNNDNFSRCPFCLAENSHVEPKPEKEKVNKEKEFMKTKSKEKSFIDVQNRIKNQKDLSVTEKNFLLGNGVTTIYDIDNMSDEKRKHIFSRMSKKGIQCLIDSVEKHRQYRKNSDQKSTLQEDENEDKDMKIIYIPELSVRARNVLMRNGIECFSDLAKIIGFDKEASKLFEFRNAGKKTIAEILEVYSLYEEKISFAGAASKSEDKSNKFALIEDVYKDYPDFVEKCKENHIRYICNLLNVNFAVFLKDFELEQALEIKRTFDTQLPTEKSYVFPRIHKSYNKVNIRILRGVGFCDSSINDLSYSGIKTIGQLQFIEANQMHHLQISYETMENKQELEEILNKDFHKHFQWFFNLEKLSDAYEILMKRSNGVTLEEIGKEYNVTRERIRQKERKAIFFVTRVLEEFLIIFFDSKDFAKKSEIKSYVKEPQAYKIIEYVYKKKDNTFSYIDFAEIFVYSKEKENMLETLQSVLLSIVDEEVDIEEEFETIDELLKENGIEFMEPENILAYLKNCGYETNKNFAYKKTNSYGKMVAKIVEQKYPDGVEIYKKEIIEKLKKDFINKYGPYKFTKNNRAFSSRVMDYLILCGRGIYKSPKHIKVEKNTLKKIIEYIENSTNNSFYFIELFAEFKGILEVTSNIDNYNYLHGVLQYYYPNKFRYRKDSLTKNNSNVTEEKVENRIRELIKQKGRPVTKKEIFQKMPWLTEIMYTTALINDYNIFLWDTNKIISDDIVDISKENVERVGSVIEKLLEENRGYCTSSLLYNYMKKQNKMFLKENAIESNKSIFYFANKLLENKYVFRYPHILRNELYTGDIKKDVTNILCNKDKIRSFSEMVKIGKKYGWYYIMMRTMFEEATKDFVCVSQDYYIKKENLNIKRPDLIKIEQVILNSMEHNILKLAEFECFHELPNLGIAWTQFLLKSVVEQYIPDLKVMSPKSKDKRYVKEIVVPTNTQITSYQEALDLYLKACGKEHNSKQEKESFLEMNGFFL